MVDVLARCFHGRRRQRALAALSSMVGAVVLARLSDDEVLSQELLSAARTVAGLR
jgi:TetR/AcrR family transcriptional repressor of nem operon